MSLKELIATVYIATILKYLMHEFYDYFFVFCNKLITNIVYTCDMPKGLRAVKQCC